MTVVFIYMHLCSHLSNVNRFDTYSKECICMCMNGMAKSVALNS